jgi:adenine phosphoribosyltransferase
MALWVLSEARLRERRKGLTWRPTTFQDEFEMSVGCLSTGAQVAIVDDLIATGGSAKGAGELVKQLGGTVSTYLFVVELVDLGGAKVLDAPTYSLIKAEGD